MKDINKDKRDIDLPGICQFLSKVCPKDCRENGALDVIDEKKSKMVMKKRKTKSLWRNKKWTNEEMIIQFRKDDHNWNQHVGPYHSESLDPRTISERIYFIQDE